MENIVRATVPSPRLSYLPNVISFTELQQRLMALASGDTHLVHLACRMSRTLFYVPTLAAREGTLLNSVSPWRRLSGITAGSSSALHFLHFCKPNEGFESLGDFLVIIMMVMKVMMISETPQGRAVLHLRDDKTRASFLASMDLSDCNAAFGPLREKLLESHLSGNTFHHTFQITHRLRSLSKHTKS